MHLDLSSFRWDTYTYHVRAFMCARLCGAATRLRMTCVFAYFAQRQSAQCAYEAEQVVNPDRSARRMHACRSIKAFADAFLAKNLKLDVLVNNAGIFLVPHDFTQVHMRMPPLL